jgi:uncharacterized membrane protein YidH (DUF202 family)
MPTFDGGHYFLTALVPIRTGMVDDGHAVTSPVHALRKRLSMLPATQAPFARNTRNHFARLVIIDDVAYNGRVVRNTLVSALLSTVLTNPQPQDHLRCPFLLLAVEFDAKDGSDQERDAYLVELWNTMDKELGDIFEFCQDFDTQDMDGAKFAAYVARCQLETTMSFNDYYIDPPNLVSWPYKAATIVVAVALLLSLVAALVFPIVGLFTPAAWVRTAFWLSVLGVGVLAALIVVAFFSITAFGRRPFPTAPDSSLPTVLKALHLQRAFTRFVIEHQMAAAGADAVSAQKLYDEFKAFVAANKPDDLAGPTQAPGVIGI